MMAHFHCDNGARNKWLPVVLDARVPDADALHAPEPVRLLIKDLGRERWDVVPPIAFACNIKVVGAPVLGEKVEPPLKEGVGVVCGDLVVGGESS